MSYPRTGSIYKLTSDKTDKIYIGSTSLKLDQRFKAHKREYAKRDNPNYKGSKANHCLFENEAEVKMELLEEIELTTPDLKPLRKIEQKYINEFRNSCCNKMSACKPDEEPEPLDRILYRDYNEPYYQMLKRNHNFIFVKGEFRSYTPEERKIVDTDKQKADIHTKSMIELYHNHYNKKIKEGKDEVNAKRLTSKYVSNKMKKILN